MFVFDAIFFKHTIYLLQLILSVIVEIFFELIISKHRLKIYFVM